MSRKKMTANEAAAMILRLVDEGHLLYHGGWPREKMERSYSAVGDTNKVICDRLMAEPLPA